MQTRTNGRERWKLDLPCWLSSCSLFCEVAVMASRVFTCPFFHTTQSLSTRPQSGHLPLLLLLLLLLQRHQSSSMLPPSGEVCWKPCPPVSPSISTLWPHGLLQSKTNMALRGLSRDVTGPSKKLFQPLRIMASRE